MMRAWCAGIVVLVVCQGCASFHDGVSPNMQKSLARGAGDVSMTATLDEGVSKADAEEITQALIDIVETQTITLEVLTKRARAAVSSEHADYVNALLDAIPDEVGMADVIPDDVKKLLLAFLKDGAMHGAALYDESERPDDDSDSP